MYYKTNFYCFKNNILLYHHLFAYMHVSFLELSFSEGKVLLIIKFANAWINICETDCNNVYDRVKYVNIFQCALKVFLVSWENQVRWLSVRSDYKMSSNRKRRYNWYWSHADILVYFLIFLNFFSREHHMNLCTKYNVYIMFLT